MGDEDEQRRPGEKGHVEPEDLEAGRLAPRRRGTAIDAEGEPHEEVSLSNPMSTAPAIATVLTARAGTSRPPTSGSRWGNTSPQGRTRPIVSAAAPSETTDRPAM
jgi:hypothetical protein